MTTIQISPALGSGSELYVQLYVLASNMLLFRIKPLSVQYYLKWKVSKALCGFFPLITKSVRILLIFIIGAQNSKPQNIIRSSSPYPYHTPTLSLSSPPCLRFISPSPPHFHLLLLNPSSQPFP